MKKHPLAGAHGRARTLRRRMTDAERAVWRLIRARQIDGRRFRRQVPRGRYVVDFVCHDARLVVEVDGGQHDPASPGEIARTRFLEGEGYRVLLRFWNTGVLQNPEGVWVTVAVALGEASPPPQPSPIEGEGENIPLLRVPNPGGLP
jgi:very-short-patch-repair endonuclease